MNRVMKLEEPATTRVMPITGVLMGVVSWEALFGIGRRIGIFWERGWREGDLRIEWKMMPHSMTRTLEVSSLLEGLSAGFSASSSLLGLFARVSASASPFWASSSVDLGATP